MKRTRRVRISPKRTPKVVTGDDFFGRNGLVNCARSAKSLADCGQQVFVTGWPCTCYPIAHVLRLLPSGEGSHRELRVSFDPLECSVLNASATGVCLMGIPGDARQRERIALRTSGYGRRCGLLRPVTERAKLYDGAGCGVPSLGPVSSVGQSQTVEFLVIRRLNLSILTVTSHG
jgi:hypothetical protein